jgi:hypothetical protein
MAQTQIRTTVYLDENLYLAAKKKAVEERTTLTDLIKTGLKYRLSAADKKAAPRRLLLGTHNLGLKNRKNTFRREEIYADPRF